MKILILYYSYGGNTRSVAEMIQQEIGGDLVEIETEKPYTGSYEAVVNQGQREVNQGFMPKLKPLSARLEDYDRIVLGSPVWWYTFAPAVKTFLHQYDLSGKTVYPFSTNGGWPGHLLKDVMRVCRDADVKDGMNIRFEGKQLVTEKKEILKWAEQVLT